MPLPNKTSFTLLELADILSGNPSAAARSPFIARLLAALWRGEFEAFSPEPYEPCREATLRALQFCDAVPEFPEEELELEYERLSRLEFEDYDQVGQAVLMTTEFPRSVITGWRLSLQGAADNLDNTPHKEQSSPSTTGMGRPTKHDYGEIDELLADLFNNKGKKGFASTGEVVRYLRGEIGEQGLPSNSTLRSHIESWFKKRSIHP